MKEFVFSFLFLAVIGLGITSFDNAYADSFTAAISGNWDDPTTWGGSVPLGNSDDVTIPVGIIVTVDETFNSDPIDIDDLDVDGTLIISKSFNVQTSTQNSGTITINDIDDIEPYSVFYGTFQNSGIFNVQAASEVELFTNTATGSLNISHEFGFFDESSNAGTITISDTVFSTTFDVDFTNTSTITNNGPVFFSDGIFTNSGTFTNNPTGNINTDAIVETSGAFINNGQIDNNNEFRSLTGSTGFLNNLGASFSNFGILTNFHIVNNDGTITNLDTITNTGTFNNNNELFIDCDTTITGTISGNTPISICADDPPVFTSFPADIVQSTDAGKDYATVIYAFPTASAGGVSATVVLLPTGVPPGSINLPSNSQFQLGTTLHTFRATDAEGQTTDQTLTVTISDGEGPVITLNGPASISLNVGDTYTEQGATATDNVDTSVTVNIGGDTVDTSTPGTYVVTYDAQDTAGNAATQVERTVTVSDNVGPVISDTPLDMMVPTDAGSNSAVVSWSPVVTATDAVDGSVPVVVTSAPTTGLGNGSTFPLGDTIVTFTATDLSGNVSTTSFTVTVSDNQGPVITLNGPASISLNVGDTYTEQGATATDNVDTSVTVNIGGDTVDTSTPGTYVVTYDAQDTAGNAATQVERTVTVSDNVGPVISDTPLDMMVPTDAGSNSAVVSWSPVVTATDAVDGSVPVVVTSAPTTGLGNGSTFPLGDTIVTFTATDLSGNVSTTSFTVTVSDSEAPMISGMPLDITVPLPFGATTAPVSWSEPTITDNVDGTITPVVTSGPTTGLGNGSEFPVGTTTVTYTATDSDGNVSTEFFTVTVTSSSLFTAVQNGDWNDPLTWDLGIVPPETDDKLIPSEFTVSNTNSLSNSGDIEILGTLNNDCGSTISNTGTVTGVVTEILCIPNLVSPLTGDLINEERPDLTWEENTLELRPIIYSPYLEDTANPSVPIELVSLSLVSAEPLNPALDGTYAWNVFVDIDPLYNPGYPFIVPTISSDIATYDVVVIDTTPPVISGIPLDIVQLVPTGTADIEVIWTPPTATDNIAITSFSSNFIPGNNFPFGVTTVTYTATDTSGNETTESFTVTVTDGVGPVITGMPADITTDVDPGQTTAIVSWTEPTVTDDVSGTLIPTITSAPTTGLVSGSAFPIGITTVTYSATDAEGNTATESFTVTVNDLVELFCGLPIEAYDQVIYGTPSNDRLRGTQGNDLIFGYAGNDKIIGLKGNDCIFGGDGKDKINGNRGMDEIHGGDGNDKIRGGNDNDKLFGDDGKDVIHGNNGDDMIDGGDHYDFCKGGRGSDTITNCERGDPNTETGDQKQLTGTIRDFKKNHDDMEQGCSGGLCSTVETGIVKSVLGADGKPEFNQDTISTNGQANFDQWYNDVNGVNKSDDITITLDNSITSDPTVYTFDSGPGFFPIDGKLFGKQGLPHNYHFTIEFHSTIEFQEGQMFKFTGDDDVWVFIDDKLVIDLGGVHPKKSAEITSADLISNGLVPGVTYDIDIFFAERQTVQSNFRIDTSMGMS